MKMRRYSKYICVFQLKQKLEDGGVKGEIKVSWEKQSDGKIFQKEKKKKDEF